MPKFATKAADNMFCQARYEAAKFNERLSSREGAAEELGVDRTRLARIELGSVTPYPEEVLLMADIYRAPELKGNYAGKCALWEKECQRSRIRILIGLHSGRCAHSGRSTKPKNSCWILRQMELLQRMKSQI